MQPSIRKLAARAVTPLARRVTAQSGRLLMYHRFGEPGEPRKTDVTTFSAQLELLKKDFAPRRLCDVVARLEAGEALDPNTVVVTVDDGYSDFAEYAVPMLLNYEIPATVYVVSDFVGQKIWLWFDALRSIIDRAEAKKHRITLGSRAHVAVLDSEIDRHTLWLLVADHCLALAPVELWAAIESVQRELGVALPEAPLPDYAAMTWDQIKALDPQLIEIGAHTRTHAVLSRCSAEIQRQEIDDCKRAIEERTGRAAEAFCYPNGMPGDFNDETVSIVQDLGFRSAVMAHGGLCHRTSDRFRLERLVAPTDLRMFANAVNGLWHLRDIARRPDVGGHL